MSNRSANTDILFLAQNLEVGGSQRQLVLLARGLAARGHKITVATFYRGGSLGAELANSEVRLVSADKVGRWDVFGFLRRLVRLVRSERPGIIHGYLDVPNLLSLVLHQFARESRVVWGVRSAYVDWLRFDRVTRLSFGLGCRLAKFADLIIFNSFAGREHHCRFGYPMARSAVVHNGIDTEMFKPDGVARRETRTELGVDASDVLIGLVARMDPLKGHLVFLEAAARLAKQRPGMKFLCVGDGTPSFREKLESVAGRLELGNRMIWVQPQSDIVRIYNALDLSVSASEGEAFSNVIGESMSCGVPCVVTDTGDSAEIVGDPRLVVPADDPSALADALSDVIDRLEPALGAWCRARITHHFSIDRLVTETQAVLGLPNRTQSAPLLQATGAE